MTGIPSFSEFAATETFRRLSDISQFRLSVTIPPITVFSDPEAVRRIRERLFEQVRLAVRACGFHFEDELVARKGAGFVAVHYADDLFDFSLMCSETTLTITRSGSRLASFHHWYVDFMPRAHQLIQQVAAMLGEESQRQVDILRGMYEFRFVVHDFRADATGRDVRNLDIVQKLLRAFPDELGEMTENPSALGSMGRIDISMSRFIGEPGHRRRLRFGIEAPGNRDYGGLWFSFVYLGESYKGVQTASREPFDAEEFLAEYERVYVEFLRDTAINGFMEWLLRGFGFRGSPGGIP